MIHDMSIADLAIGLLIFKIDFIDDKFYHILLTALVLLPWQYIKFEILKYTTAITHQILINCSTVKLYSLFTIFSKIREFKNNNKRGKANENTRN